METVKDIIGVMDPNGYSFRVTFEKLIEFLAPKIPYDGKLHQVVTQRIKTRPYDVLDAYCPYSAVINRGAHWNPHHNNFFMTVGHGTYLLNDMVSFASINKNATYGHMHQLGLHIPPTLALPQHDYEDIKNDPRAIPELIFSEHEPFDIEELGNLIGYPAFLKPQAGGGWIGVRKVHNTQELVAAYSFSGNKPMNLQKAVDYREFVRAIGIGPQILPMHYNPEARYPHDRYMRSENRAVDFHFLSQQEKDEVIRISKVVNAFYNWDHNSCEILIAQDGLCHLIDFANAYPDSSLISLHFYFPEMVKCMVKWLIFCAVTRKKKSFHFARDWDKYFAVTRETQDYSERLRRYAQIADEYFETEKFNAFCREYMSDFEEKSLEFFSSPDFEQIIEQKVRYHFKVAKEIPEKIEHYKGIHRFWVHCQKAAAEEQL